MGPKPLLDLKSALSDPRGKGPIAQFWSERTPDKREVDGSSPSRPTTRARPWTRIRRAWCRD